MEGPRRLGQSPQTPLRGSLIPLPTPYLQSLEEAEGAQAPAPGHDAEGGVVQQLLVVKPGVGDGVGVRHGPLPSWEVWSQPRAALGWFGLILALSIPGSAGAEIS